MDLNAKIAEEEAKLAEPKAPEAESKPEIKPEPATPSPEPKELDESVYAAFEKDIPGSSAGIKRIVEQEKQARDQARAKAEEADKILNEAREKAKKIEEESRLSADQSDLRRAVALMVKKGAYTQDQADEYLESQGIATKPTLDEIARVVVEAQERAYERLKAEQKAETDKREQDEIRSKVQKAFQIIQTADPKLDNDDVLYLLKKETKKNPKLTIEQATDEVVKRLKPVPKEPDKKGDDPLDDKAIEEEKKSIFQRLKLT
jgi:hypothetical protein